MDIARMIAANSAGAVTGIKALLLQQKGEGVERQWAMERDYTTSVFKGARATDAFPDFLARHPSSA